MEYHDNRQVQYTIPPKVRWKLVKDALKVAIAVRLDQLDCSVSMSRQRTDKSLEEVCAILKKDKKAYWTFIYRDVAQYGQDNHGELCASNMTGHPTYFLWINMIPADMFDLTRKYNLTRR